MCILGEKREMVSGVQVIVSSGARSTSKIHNIIYNIRDAFLFKCVEYL